MSRPRSRRPTRTHRSDAVLLGVLGGVAALGLIALLIGLAMKGNKGPRPLATFATDWNIAPVWKTPPHSRTDSSEDADGGLEIYLDLSEPMQGYLAPPAAPEEPSGFRSLVSQIPDQLVSVAGGSSSPVRWFGVASAADQPLKPPAPLRRTHFRGSESRLDLALLRIIDRLKSGDAEVAALVSDLIATEQLVGAMGAAKALSDWGRSDGVRSGELGVGLLGIRGSYWGVYGKCAASADAGCWFSEQAKQYRPLTRIIQRPFYVLLLGRNLDSVDQSGKALSEAAEKLGLEAHWELLSESARTRPVKVECQARKAEENQGQYALFRGEDGSFTCRRAETVDLLCALPKGVFENTPSIKATWADVRTEIQEDGPALIAIDCARLRSNPPQNDLFIEVEGTPAAGKAGSWGEWSAETDDVEAELERTLRLKNFVNKVRLHPDRIRITSPALLKAQAP